jgi:hypothetical protein
VIADYTFEQKITDMIFSKQRQYRKASVLIGCILATVLTSFFQPTDALTMKDTSTDHGNGQGFAVVELFTSEGCSSCPPADKLIAKVQEENVGKNVYILAFHVDYWDHQGWKDVFGSRDFTKRQYQYANWLKLETVYTPQAVVNGKQEFVGSQETTLNNAIASGLRTSSQASLTIEAKREQNKITLEYQTKGTGNSALLQLALVQKVAQTVVKRGENAGRLLPHVQIVRQIQTQQIGINGAGHAEIMLPGDFDPKGWEVIGFLQNKSNGEILAATKSKG